MSVLFILNDPPYGTERCYNALRLAQTLLKEGTESEITMFLMADAVVCAKRGQKTPQGYYNMEKMLMQVIAGEAKILLCGTCMDARGLSDADMINGTKRSTMNELANATKSTDRIFVF